VTFISQKTLFVSVAKSFRIWYEFRENLQSNPDFAKKKKFEEKFM